MERRREAGVPDEVTFTTKPALAKRMLACAFAAALPAACVTGDAISGDESAFRCWLADDAFTRRMAELESEALSMSCDAGSQALPPVECDACDHAFQGLMATFHNIFVPFATWSKIDRDWRFKERHVSTYLEDFDEKLGQFQYEWRKVR